MLADEPTGNLDAALSFEIMSLFEQFQKIGVTVVVATHDNDLIRQLPHRELQLEHGKLHQETPITPQTEPTPLSDCLISVIGFINKNAR